MYGLDKESWKEWQAKRGRTLIGLIIVGSVSGVSNTIVLNTMVAYLKDIVQVANPALWYGLITSAFLISSALLGMVCGRWVDKTRNLRCYVLAIILVQIIGYGLYLLYWHPIFLLVGRIFCGLSDSFTSVAVSEVYRIYDGPDATAATVWLGIVNAVGFAVGPGFTVLFKGIDFQIGSLLINRLNFVSIFMTGWLILCIFPAYFLIHDCSKMFDLKEYLTKQALDEVGSNAIEDGTMEDGSMEDEITEDETMEDETMKDETMEDETMEDETMKDETMEDETIEDETMEESQSLLEPRPAQSENKVEPPIKVIKALLKDPNSRFLIVASCLFMYGVFTLFALVPLLFTVTLKWSVDSLSAFYVICGAVELTTLLTIKKCAKTNRSIYLSAIISISCQITESLALIGLIVLKDYSREFDYFLIAVYLVTMEVSYSFDQVMIKVMFSKLIPSHVQGFSETFRSAMVRFATIAGSLTVSVILPYVHWWAIGMIVVYMGVLIMFIIRRKALVHPNQVKL